VIDEEMRLRWGYCRTYQQKKSCSFEKQYGMVYVIDVFGCVNRIDPVSRYTQNVDVPYP
jgi:hypothetical protein